MTTYIDSSALLRLVLGSPGAIPNWRSIEHPVSSVLIEVECLRTLDRLRLTERIDDEVIADRRQLVYRLLSGMDFMEIGRVVINRASQPLPVPLRTLDAIHLATAMIWREAEQDDVQIATHDTALALAARSIGFTVIGV